MTIKWWITVFGAGMIAILTGVRLHRVYSQGHHGVLVPVLLRLLVSVLAVASLARARFVADEKHTAAIQFGIFMINSLANDSLGR